MSARVFCRIRLFSTFAQFGLIGTNQVDLADAANGASFGSDEAASSSVVLFGMLPALTRPCSDWPSVNALTQAADQSWCWLLAVIARSDPPMKDCMAPPFEPGIAKTPILSASAGSPPLSLGAPTEPASQPRPYIIATCPWAITVYCCGLASSIVLSPRLSFWTRSFHRV